MHFEPERTGFDGRKAPGGISIRGLNPVDDASNPPVLMSVGHSNRSIEEFLDLLKAHRVDLLVDVRTVPRSRHNPQFNRELLPDALRAAGIGYLHLPGLGGLRRPQKDSGNTAWRNLSFRGYADYMQTPEFETALGKLLTSASGRRAAIMCAEAVPWRCHRSLIADALVARGIIVSHVITDGPAQAHKVTPFARVNGTRVSYPGLLDESQ